MVAEACQDTGHVYTSYSGYGDITIQSNDCDPPIATLITITDPWSNNHTDQIMSIGTIKTFTSGSEVYTVEMTDMFCGAETTWSDYTECWWTEDGNRYVKTSGSNSTLGNSWTNAWLTMGYGFQNIPSGKDLYVEEGLYGGETLSNLDPPQTMKMYIQPSGHTETVCNVWVNSTDTFDVNSFSWAGPNPFSSYNYTVILTGASIPYTGIISAFDVYSNVTGSIKLKVFRDDGTNFVFIGEGEYEPINNSENYFVNAGGIVVQSGDLLGYIGDSVATFQVMFDTETGHTIYRHSGDVTSTTLKSSWSTFSNNRLMLIGKGFKSI